MMRCAPAARLFSFVLLLCAAIFLTGCSQFKRGAVSEEKDPHYLQGQNRNKSMDWDGAIESFNRALQSNPTNAAAHFELGVLYDHRKKEPAAAIHHYQEHLKLRTNSPMADVVKQQIIACKRELAKEVLYAVAPRDLQLDLERQIQTNALLEKRIEGLQIELSRRPQYVTNYVTNLVQVQMPTFNPRNSSRLTQPAEIMQAPAGDPVLETEPPEAVVRPAATLAQERPAAVQSRAPRSQRQESPRAASSTPPPSGPRKAQGSHTVRPGDTMEVIARRYGVSVAALKAANPAAKSGARSGQKLVIPER